MDKMDRSVAESYMKRIPEEALDEWAEACEDDELMSAEEQQAWIENARSSDPRIDALPDSDSPNDVSGSAMADDCVWPACGFR
jgi:hypothetical protein